MRLNRTLRINLRASELKFTALIIILMVALVSCSTTPEQSGNAPAPEPLILTDERERYPLGLYLEILEDPRGNLTIEDVKSLEFSSRFIPSQVDVPNFGITSSVYWIRFRLRNDSRMNDQWLLDVGFPKMHYLDLYTPVSGEEVYSVKHTGTLRPPSTRDIIHPRIILNLHIPTHSEQTFYMRFQNNASMTLPLVVWTPTAFWTLSQLELGIFGLFFGILIGLLFYNLFLFVSLRELSYLYFVVFVASVIIHQLSFIGIIGNIIVPNYYFLEKFFHSIPSATLFISLILFTDRFMEVNTRLPKLHFMNLASIGIWGVLLLLTPFASYLTLYNLHTSWALVSVALTLVSGIASYWKGYLPARFILIAWTGMVVSILIVVMARIGLLPSTTFTESAFRLGIIWMTVCMSVALADRINLMKNELEYTNLKLHASELRYRQLVERMNDGLGVVDNDGRYTFANERMEKMLGYSEGELIGHSVTEFMDEANQQVLVTQLENRKTGSTTPYELTWLKNDGTEIITHVSPMPLYEHGSGLYKGSFAVITDITERVLAERLLERRVIERTQELSTLLEISRDITAAEDLKPLLDQILNRLKTVVNYHGATILAEKQGTWGILAQDWPSLPSPSATLKLSGSQVQDIRNEFAHGEPLLIKNVDQERSNGVGFTALTARLSLNIEDSCCWFGIPLFEQKSMIGLFVLGCSGPAVIAEQSNVIVASANQMAIAIENNHLYQQIRESVMVDERNRLARELHDSVTQTLFTASVLAEATPRIWDINREIAYLNMEKLGVLIRGALAEMRSMLIELRSGELGDQSLDTLVNTLAEAIQARMRIRVSMSLMEIPELPKEVTLTFYRIAREALNNVLVHAGASQVNITLFQKNGTVELHIRDDGKGFDPEVIPTGHLGIKIMGERAAEIGGDLRILSEPNRGTEIIFTWSDETGGPEPND